MTHAKIRRSSAEYKTGGEVKMRELATLPGIVFLIPFIPVGLASKRLANAQVFGSISADGAKPMTHIEPDEREINCSPMHCQRMGRLGDVGRSRETSMVCPTAAVGR
jgi:hypothetical protein